MDLDTSKNIQLQLSPAFYQTRMFNSLHIKDHFMLACSYHTSNSFINESTVLVDLLYKALKILIGKYF